MNDLAHLAPSRHKLDVDAFFRMAEFGIIGMHERIELIDGELIDMAPIGNDHAGTVNWLGRALFRACQERAIVGIQNPIQLDAKNLPQPDFAILQPRDDFYRSDPAPGPADTLAVIEVADSSLHYDSTIKLGLYARFGIPEYWIVDLAGRRLLVHRGPGPTGYTDIAVHRPGALLALAAAPDIVLNLDDLFP